MSVGQSQIDFDAQDRRRERKQQKRKALPSGFVWVFRRHDSTYFIPHRMDCEWIAEMSKIGAKLSRENQLIRDLMSVGV